MKYFVLLIISIFINPMTFSGESVVLTKKYFEELNQEMLPAYKKILLAKDSSELNKSLFDDQLSPYFNMSLTYGENKSRQLNRFVPVTSPTKRAQLGISKATLLGLNIEANIFAEQFSNNFLRRSTTVGSSLNFSLDLYQDILGRSSRKKYANSKDDLKIKKLEKEMFSHQLKISLSKLYWNLVANEESITITKMLIEQAKRQVSITAEKVRNSVSDRGTLARMKSILASRQGSLNTLHYQRSNLHRSLRELVPELQGKDISMGAYSIDQTIAELFICTDKIEQLSSAPLEMTVLDDIAAIVQEIKKREILLADIHNDIDLKLFAQTQFNGKDFGYEDGFQNLKDDPRAVAQIGIELRAPIGSQLTKSAKIRKKIGQHQKEINTQETQAKLDAYHMEIINSVKVLKAALKNQKENNTSLKISLETSRQKFSQARISIEQLVGEEDAYFASELDNIRTNLSILMTILDYFSVFNQTKCSLNS